jgi:hypothetical protein
LDKGYKETTWPVRCWPGVDVRPVSLFKLSVQKLSGLRVMPFNNLFHQFETPG